MSSASAPSRREFLAWVGLSLPALAALSAFARRAAAAGAPLATLTPAEARAMSAFAAQIFPAGELPGTADAEVLHFIDQGLGTYFGQMLDVVRAGLADLDARARAATPPAPDFAALPAPAQVATMKAVEQTQFFFVARMLTVMGMFADPSYGGNKDGVGWRLLGVEHEAVYQPPFGYYDAEDGR